MLQNIPHLHTNKNKCIYIHACVCRIVTFTTKVFAKNIYSKNILIQREFVISWHYKATHIDAPAWTPSSCPGGRSLCGTRRLPWLPPTAASTTHPSSSPPPWTRPGWRDCRQCPAPERHTTTLVIFRTGSTNFGTGSKNFSVYRIFRTVIKISKIYFCYISVLFLVVVSMVLFLFLIQWFQTPYSENFNQIIVEKKRKNI